MHISRKNNWFIPLLILQIFIFSGNHDRLNSRVPINRFFANRFVYSQIKAPTRANPKNIKEVVELIGNARVFRGERALFANRIKVIGRNVEKAFAFGKVRAFDHKGNSMLTGSYGEYHKYPESSDKKSFTRITGKPVLIYSRKGEPKAERKLDRESYKVYVYGKVFTRMEGEKKVFVEGPVTFRKSNELFYGKSLKAVYLEKEELLRLSGDCEIFRGDDHYKADQIQYYTGKRILKLSGQVQLTLYDYRLDPLQESFRSPFSSGKKTVNTAPTGKEKDSPFHKRKYSVLKKLAPANREHRLELRRFLDSRLDVFGKEMVYNRQDQDKVFISVTGSALFRNINSVFKADFIKVKGSGDKIILAYNNLYFERFNDSSYGFGKIMEYHEREKWGRIYDKAQLILLSDKKGEAQKKSLQSMHLFGDEIERFLELKKIYLKGNVEIKQDQEKFIGTYARYDELKKIFNLIGAPELRKRDSSLFSNAIGIDLNQEVAEMDQSLQGIFFEEKNQGKDSFKISESSFFYDKKRLEKILDMGIDKRVWGSLFLPNPFYY